MSKPTQDTNKKTQSVSNKSILWLKLTHVKGVFAFVISAIAGAILLSACTTMAKVSEPVQYVSFDKYRSETLEKLRERRSFQQANTEMELQWNAPREWRAAAYNLSAKPSKGILLVHGLGDSPWSFHEIAKEFAAQGFLVRSILLPGHGTDPSDMLNVTAEEWQEVVYEQAQALERDVDGEVYLGGFSTGANLVLSYAYEYPEIAGLVLFSPGFKSFFFDWLAPLVSTVRPWIIEPGDDVPGQTPIRYMNVPTNGYAQYYRTGVAARRLLDRPYNKPVFMAIAQHDSVLDTDYLLDVFLNQFTHPHSRLIWYGDKPDGLTDTTRILFRADRLPEQRISQFSHMGLLFSPENPLYGSKGSLRICLNSMDRQEREACEQGADLWFSAWGHHEDGKVHARLTFNPYFQWQASVMMSVLDGQDRPLTSDIEAVMPRHISSHDEP